MEIETVLLAASSALAGSIIGGMMTMLGILLTNWLNIRTEKRREKRRQRQERIEKMRGYLGKTTAIAARVSAIEEILPDDEDTKNWFLKIWFEDVYQFRIYFYEIDELREHLAEFDKIFVETLEPVMHF